MNAFILLTCGLALEALLTLYSFFYSPVQPLSVATARIYTTFKDAKLYFLQTQLIFCVSYCIPLPVKLKV